MKPDFRAVCERMAALASEAGDYIRSESKNLRSGDVLHKGFNDLVTHVDREAERLLVDGLKKIQPEAGFITEENTLTDTGKPLVWVVDPLDGTTNFVHGVPCYCVSVALLENGRAAAGVVYEVNLDESFYAWKDSPAFLNGKEIRVSGTAALKDSLLATGFPYTRFDRLEGYMKVFDYCMKNTHGLRRLGSAAVDLAYVAAGRFDGFFEYGLNAWDVAAGAFIVQQAGGKVADFSGGTDFLFGGEIVAMNEKVFEEFLEVVKEGFRI
jgi:myo-inositol-1(or 4)-monophosphatase